MTSQFNMARVFVSVGINRDGFDAHFASCEDDAASDFASVGDEDFFEHGNLSFTNNAIEKMGSTAIFGYGFHENFSVAMRLLQVREMSTVFKLNKFCMRHQAQQRAGLGMAMRPV